MKDYKIVIDASHGGTDTGVTGNNIIEKDFSLNISNYIYNKLKDLGYDVSLTRDNEQLLSNEERINKINDIYGDNNNVIVISNHLSDSESGVEIIYALRNSNRLADSIANEMKKNNIDVSKVYQRRLPSDTAKDYYYIHRETKNAQPILISYGNVSDIDESNKLKDYQKYGDAVVLGINDYLELGQIDTNDKYVVKSGDSLWSISKKYNISVEDLKKINSLNSNLLNIGQVLKIPTIEVPPSIGNFKVYTVEQGDTLYNIARKYNVTVDDVIDYNDLSTNKLKLGQQLLIPILNAEDDNVYIVKSGDTLYTISNKYGISVNELKTYNNLSSNILNIGQKLKIPQSNSSSSTFLDYIVKRGDSLYSIASKYNTNVSEIMKANNLNTNLINVGQVLKIPNLGN